ncbi:Gar1-domain-containing protein [Daedalea quercina L-15889]|uniref:H/ACA ribonucleoprotein complex subunit n=1 Tax=Daedalea quercina L-15889 TaxID=1314783 RepID=A0A165NA72_9APHY|nr:Gar1-domain-containing protein [Daedalea quercina L-15889]
MAGRGGGRGGYTQRDAGPPDTVLEMGSFIHAVEQQMLCQSLMPEKVPYFNAPIYLANKSLIGKVDEILGPINEVYFSVTMEEGMVATSFKKGDKVYIGGDKLLPVERFLPKPKIAGGAYRSFFIYTDTLRGNLYGTAGVSSTHLLTTRLAPSTDRFHRTRPWGTGWCRRTRTRCTRRPGLLKRRPQRWRAWWVERWVQRRPWRRSWRRSWCAKSRTRRLRRRQSGWSWLPGLIVGAGISPVLCFSPVRYVYHVSLPLVSNSPVKFHCAVHGNGINTRQ